MNTDKMRSLEQELSRLYSQNGQTIEMHSKIPLRNTKKLIKQLKEENEGALATQDLFKGTLYTKMPDGSTKCVSDALSVQFADLKKYALVDKLIEALDEIDSEKKIARKKNAYEFSKPETLIKECTETDDKHIYIDADLDLDISIAAYNKADRDFFNWWARDSAGNTYLRKSEGGFMRVPFLDGAVKKIALDPDFWTVFYKEHRGDIERFKQHIINTVYDEYEHNVEDYQSQDAGMMGRIHEVVPKALLDCFGYELSVFVEKIEQKDAKGNTKILTIKHLDGVNMKAKVTMNVFKNPTDKNIKIALTDMLTGIDVSEFPLLEDFTNVRTTLAKYYFNTAALYDSPYPNISAKMPSYWEDFFSTAFVNMPLTQKYRLAKWIKLLLTANSKNRQALLLTGAGYDGKSVFVNALKRILDDTLGRGFITSCNEAGFEPDNTQNGLVHCLDSRLIYIPELTNPSQFIGGLTFKSITGGDEITCQVKYKAPIVKSMDGVKFILVTNKIVYLNEPHSFSRIANLYFSPKPKNFKVRESYEIEQELASQGKEFLHWCFTFSTKMDELLHLPDNVIPITNIDKMVGVEGVTALTDMKDAFEGIYGDDDCRCFFKVYDDSQQDKETLYAKFCNEAIDKEQGESLTYPELYAAWNDWVYYSKFTNTCRNISIGIGGKDSRNFVKYVKDFFHADTTYVKTKGQSFRALCNLTTRQASAEKKPVTPIKPVSDWT